MHNIRRTVESSLKTTFDIQICSIQNGWVTRTQVSQMIDFLDSCIDLTVPLTLKPSSHNFLVKHEAMYPEQPVTTTVVRL